MVAGWNSEARPGSVPRARGAECGLTLVEVLVSSLILMFVGMASISLVTYSIHQNKLARMRSIATSLAAERVDQITSVPFETAAAYATYGLPGETADNGPPRTLTAGYGDITEYPEFRRVVRLDYDVPVSGMLKVKVQVFWEDLKQGEKVHELVTFLHPRLEQGQ